MMPLYKIKLINQTEIAKNTIRLTFEKPDNFTFKVGQYGGFTLINPKETDANGNTRRFSILSTPEDKHIAIATRVQNSAYKRALLALNKGDEIKFAGPTGNFTLHEDKSIPAIFIAGGIGIAPFFSMITEATQQQSPQNLFLFYGNQTAEDTAFYKELNNFANQNSHFKFIPTFANPESTWQGETGFITHTMIKKYVEDIHLPIYYVCGSPTMVTTLQETLVEMGIDENKIKVEDFPGY